MAPQSASQTHNRVKILLAQTFARPGRIVTQTLGGSARCLPQGAANPVNKPFVF
jgi:hypothetical protein